MTRIEHHSHRYSLYLREIFYQCLASEPNCAEMLCNVQYFIKMHFST